MWHRIEPLFTTLLNEGSPVSVKRAVILASPHLPWQKFANGERAVQLWAAAASAVPYSDAVCQSVSETLLQIAFDDILRPHIPVRMWSWLNKRPILPPVSKGRLLGSSRGVVRMVRGLGDVETLTSCLVLVWSEWNSLHPDGLDEIHASIREDFSGTRMRHHRKALLQRLDRVLGQVDLGLEHLQQQNSELNGNDIRQMKDQYGRLKEVILEVERDAIDEPICGLPKSIILFSLLTPADRCTIPPGVYVCNPSPVSVVASPEHSNPSSDPQLRLSIDCDLSSTFHVSVTQRSQNFLLVTLGLLRCCRSNGRLLWSCDRRVSSAVRGVYTLWFGVF